MNDTQHIFRVTIYLHLVIGQEGHFVCVSLCDPLQATIYGYFDC